MDALGIVRQYRELTAALDSAPGSQAQEVTTPVVGTCKGRRCKCQLPERARAGVWKCSRCGIPWTVERSLMFHGEHSSRPPRESMLLLKSTIGCALRDLARDDRRAAVVLLAYADADGLPSYQREHLAARIVRTLSHGWAPEKRERMRVLMRADEYLQERLGNALEKHT